MRPVRRLLTNVGISRLPLLPPAVPAGLVATANGANRIDLTWTAVPGATGYRVERSADGVTGWVRVSSVTTNAYSDMGLTAATTYYYRLRSYSPQADSQPGATANATTSA